MKVSVAPLLCLVLVPLATASHASARLAEQKQCVQCHSATEPGAGPSFRQIAQKYKGRSDAVKNMTAIIRKGSAATGGPHWGKATMPDASERPEVSPAEARQLAQWILQQ